MAWTTLDHETRRAAEAVCTAAELEALQLLDEGLGYRLIARRLGISRDAVRSRIENATRKIRAKGGVPS